MLFLLLGSFGSSGLRARAQAFFKSSNSTHDFESFDYSYKKGSSAATPTVTSATTWTALSECRVIDGSNGFEGDPKHVDGKFGDDWCRGGTTPSEVGRVRCIHTTYEENYMHVGVVSSSQVCSPCLRQIAVRYWARGGWRVGETGECFCPSETADSRYQKTILRHFEH